MKCAMVKRVIDVHDISKTGACLLNPGCFKNHKLLEFINMLATIGPTLTTIYGHGGGQHRQTASCCAEDGSHLDLSNLLPK